MAQVRIFNPSYTARSFFAGRAGQKGETVKHHKHHHYRRHYRRNPLGISGGVVKDAAYTAGGALASLFLAGLLPAYNTGFTGVFLTAAAGVGASFATKMVAGAPAAEEVLKGGLVAAIIRAVHQTGIAKSVGLGLYTRSAFAVPTASDAYGRVLPPAPPAARGVGGLGTPSFYRYRGRYI